MCSVFVGVDVVGTDDTLFTCDVSRRARFEGGTLLSLLDEEESEFESESESAPDLELESESESESESELDPELDDADEGPLVEAEELFTSAPDSASDSSSEEESDDDESDAELD